MCAELDDPSKFCVSLAAIAEKLEEATDGWEQYLNTVTGEFEAFPDGTYSETDLELAAKIEDSKNYIRLPNQYELHEYHIMKDFAESLPDSQVRNRLFQALNGRKSYRRFKDEIISLDATKAYYTFRSQACLAIASAWCADNGVSTS